jgi:hypothetical protein
LYATQTSTSGRTLYVTRNLASGSTDAAVVEIVQDHASDDQNVLTIRQDGAAVGAEITQNDTQGFFGLSVIAGGGALLAQLCENYNGKSAYFYRNLTSTSTGDTVVKIIQDNASDDQKALLVYQDGIQAAARFENRAGGANTNFVAMSYAGGDGGDWALVAVRDLTSATTTQPVVAIIQDNAADDQVALAVTQDGPGEAITINGIGLSNRMQLISDTTLTSDEQTHSISSLLGDTDLEYYVSWNIIVKNASNFVTLQLNADSTGGNYKSWHQEYDGTTFAQSFATQTIRIWGGFMGADYTNVGTLFLSAKTGSIRQFNSDARMYDNGTPKLLVQTHNERGAYMDTSTQITSIDFVGNAADTIKTGSRFVIYGRRK